MDWNVSISNIVGWIITLGIIGVGYWKTGVRRNVQNTASMKEIWTELRRQTKVDEELMAEDKKILAELKAGIAWGERMLAERATYNDRTFLKSDLYNICHKNLEDKVTEIIAIDIKSRFVKLEMMVQQVLLNQEEYKKDKVGK